MAYCGCATRGNRVKWAVAVIGLLVGLAFIAAAIGKSASNYSNYRDCLKGCVNQGQITAAEYNYYDNSIDWNDNKFGDTDNECVNRCQVQNFEDTSAEVAGFFWVGVAVLVLASLPCYVMCCCTRPPSSTTHAIAVPYGGPTAPYQAEGAVGSAPNIYPPNVVDGYEYPPQAHAATVEPITHKV